MDIKRKKGSPWSEDQLRHLRKLLRDPNMPLVRMAEEFGCTPGAIERRMVAGGHGQNLKEWRGWARAFDETAPEPLPEAGPVIVGGLVERLILVGNSQIRSRPVRLPDAMENQYGSRVYVSLPVFSIQPEGWAP